MHDENEKKKKKISRDIWSKVFRINPEGNPQFDQRNELIVNAFINYNAVGVLPYPQANQITMYEVFSFKSKHAKGKLIPKVNKPSTYPNNYRPISLLEMPRKIFEK